jgi:hypothetical protein
MSDSHLLDNGHIIGDSRIVSNKFEHLKSTIERDPLPQLIYSQFVYRGTVLFTDYCL